MSFYEQTIPPEQIHEYEGEHGGEKERSDVPGDAPYHVQQRLLPVDEIKELFYK